MDFDEAIKLEPQEATIYYHRGNAKRAMVDFVGAIEDYTDALHIKPDYAEALCNRGLAKYDLGDYVGATADFDESLTFFDYSNEMDFLLITGDDDLL